MTEQSTASVDSTALTVRTNLTKVETALSEFDKIEAGLAELRGKYDGVVFPVTTTAGMKEATAARAEIREPRYKTEHARKAGKAPVLELGRNIEQRAAYITDELLKIETPIDEQIKAEEARKEREREAKETAERERVARIQAQIESIREWPMNAIGKPSAVIAEFLDVARAWDYSAWAQEFTDVAEQAKVQTMTRLTTMHGLAGEAEAEAVRLQAERAEIERQKAEQAEAAKIAKKERQKRAREEKKAMDEALARRVEEDRIARESRDIQERESRARIEAQEREAREAREAADRKARDELAAQEARLRAEREKLEKERTAKEAREREAREKVEAKEKAKREKAEAVERGRKRLEAEKMDGYEFFRTGRERFGHIEEFSVVCKAIDALKQPEAA